MSEIPVGDLLKAKNMFAKWYNSIRSYQNAAVCQQVGEHMGSSDKI